MEDATETKPETAETIAKRKDRWIAVAELLMEMPAEEQVRCLVGTTVLLGHGEAVIDRLSRCTFCGSPLGSKRAR